MIEHQVENILSFLHKIEQLKQELRHSWTSKGRQESVAEHSWRLAVMVSIIAPYLSQKIDLSKAIQMALFHDLGEVVIGDQHVLDITDGQQRVSLEDKAVRSLSDFLFQKQNLIYDLWKEFESRASFEAKLVYFLDKLEVCIQHNEACLSTWTQEEVLMINDYFNQLQVEDSFLVSLKTYVFNETKKKLKSNAKIF